jgi:mannosyltransferase
MKNNKEILLLILVLIVVTGFEFSILIKIALWHDEAFSALLPRYDFKEMIYRAGLDVHPPLYYILLKGWDALFGDSLFSLRFFSVFFGILAVIIFFFFTKEILKDKKFALFATVLLMINSFFIQFVTEARMFPLGIFLVVLSSFFLLKSLNSKKWHWWFLYVISVSAGIYTHYYIIFSVLAQGIFLIYWILKESKLNLISWLKNKNFQFGLGAYLLVILSFLPWLKTFLFQNSQIQESYWIPPINIWSFPATFLKLTTGGGIDATRFWYILAALMVLVIFAFIYALKKIEQPSKWLVFLLIIIPFSGAIAFSLKTSIYLDRYFIFTLPFYLILMAGAIWLIRNKKARNILIAIAILGSLIAFPVRWVRLQVEKKPGMAAAANYLNQEVKPSEKIYVGSSFVYFTFKYYNKTGIQPKLYAPGSLPHFSGTALLSLGDIIGDFNEGIKKNDIVWMINTTGFGNYQPSLPPNWKKEEEKGFQDVYDYQGWIIVTKYQAQ